MITLTELNLQELDQSCQFVHTLAMYVIHRVFFIIYKINNIKVTTLIHFTLVLFKLISFHFNVSLFIYNRKKKFVAILLNLFFIN